MINRDLLTTVWGLSRVWLCFILAFLLLSLTLFVFQTQFVSVDTERLSIELSRLEQQYQQREAKLAETGVPISTVEQLEKNLREFSELIPEKQEFSDFLGELFTWAQKSQLNISQISYQPKIDKNTKYLNYGLSFDIVGNYYNIKEFMHHLENSKRIVIVDRIGLLGKRNEDNSSSVNLQINLKTFFREAAK